MKIFSFFLFLLTSLASSASCLDNANNLAKLRYCTQNEIDMLQQTLQPLPSTLVRHDERLNANRDEIKSAENRIKIIEDSQKKFEQDSSNNNNLLVSILGVIVTVFIASTALIAIKDYVISRNNYKKMEEELNQIHALETKNVQDLMTRLKRQAEEEISNTTTIITSQMKIDNIVHSNANFNDEEVYNIIRKLSVIRPSEAVGTLLKIKKNLLNKLSDETKTELNKAIDNAKQYIIQQ